VRGQLDADRKNASLLAGLTKGSALIDGEPCAIEEHGRFNLTLLSLSERNAILVVDLAPTIEAVTAALKTAGVQFIPENGGGAGVRLAKPRLALFIVVTQNRDFRTPRYVLLLMP
jgi:hypothetical protein